MRGVKSQLCREADRYCLHVRPADGSKTNILRGWREAQNPEGAKEETKREQGWG